ncbi:MAG: rod shape-determining protein RodA [Candidatus Nealsonbacteria bacterium]|nr:rod shape-determining protein RodA [Candidatus Nealsonbacteria bacterium]
MRNIALHFRRFDWPILICTVLLISIGLLSLYSSSIGKGDFLNFQKQVIFASIGLLLMLSISFMDWRVLKNEPHLIFILYIIGCLSLLGLLFFAPEIRAVKGWYKVGPISINPIEFLKIILIILLAKYFSMRHIEVYRIRHILFSGLYIAIPSVFIFLQPDLGQVVILIAMWLAMLLVSGVKIRFFLLLILCLVLISIISWSFFLQDYQKERISSFITFDEPLGANWSKVQAKIAIGSGGLFGQGFLHGSQTQYGFLPESQTDFIFSAIAEEFGLVGISVLLILFFVILWRIIKIALNSETNFPRLFCSGMALLLFSQIFIHIGMNLGILPIIGIPLPLVSYGGSSLIVNLIGLGIIQSIRYRILFHSFDY